MAAAAGGSGPPGSGPPGSGPGPGRGPVPVLGRTLLVRGLPATATTEDLENVFGRFGPLRRCFVVTEKGTKTCRGFGYVTFSLAEDAGRALAGTPKLGGRPLPITPARPRDGGGKKRTKEQPEKQEEAAAAVGDPKVPPRPKKAKAASRKARLIVRNLSFKCSEDDLRSLFSPFGTVVEVNIPKKPDGGPRGFAFVQLQKVPEAARALRGVNMKEIKGRPVAVDWAVAKDKYQATQPQAAESKGVGGEAEGQRDPEEEEEEEKEEEVEEEEEEDEAAEKRVKIKSPSSGKRVEEEEEDEEEDEDEDKEENESEEEEEDDEEEEKNEDEEEEETLPHRKKRGAPPPSDVSEGRTVFIRNLSFDTEEEALGELLERFGALQYVRLVLHPDTEHSRGCAFAQFRTREAALKCLEAAQGDPESGTGGLRLEGRQLRVDPAVTREEARKLRNPKPERPAGTRNLYLAREGLIRPGSKAAEGVSDADMAKRARFEELKRRKLQNPNIFVSPTRLCIHNLPKAVDSSRLRGLLMAGGGPRPKILECRVMREQRGQGPSLGYAFVEFGAHQQALAALRRLNNDPVPFGPHKRPIVEFSLEDRRKLRLKEQRTQRSLLKLRANPPQPPKTSPGQEAPETQRRGRPARAFSKAGAGGCSQKQPPPKNTAAPSSMEAAPPAEPWSGFCTQRPGRGGTAAGGKVLALPSHRGPKIRKRDKGKLKPPSAPPKKHKGKAPRKKKPNVAPPKAEQRRRRGGGRGAGGAAEAQFNQLVEKYKRKILGRGDTPTPKRTKWFEG